jgi:L-fucose isomerase-like protein
VCDSGNEVMIHCCSCGPCTLYCTLCVCLDAMRPSSKIISPAVNENKHKLAHKPSKNKYCPRFKTAGRTNQTKSCPRFEIAGQLAARTYSNKNPFTNFYANVICTSSVSVFWVNENFVLFL